MYCTHEVLVSKKIQLWTRSLDVTIILSYRRLYQQFSLAFSLACSKGLRDSKAGNYIYRAMQDLTIMVSVKG
jgi:hypothetical protein